MTDSQPMISFDHVTKSFGTKVALDEISLSVPAGQLCGLLGPNGAGKTTLFRLLMGIVKATSGKVAIDTRDAFEERTDLKRSVGFLPDEPIFYSYLSGREILALSAQMHGLEPKAALKRMTPVIEQLHLADDLDNYAEDYSRGMKKKLGLLLAMIHEPRLLILDEPTNGLDVESTQVFFDLMLVAARRGSTVIFSSHLLDQVARICSQLVIIASGRRVAQGTLDEVRALAPEATSLEQAFLHLTQTGQSHV